MDEKDSENWFQIAIQLLCVASVLGMFYGIALAQSLTH